MPHAPPRPPPPAELIEEEQTRSADCHQHALHVLDLAREAAQTLFRLVLARHAEMQRLQQRQLRVLRLSSRRGTHSGRHEAADLGKDAGDADLT